MPDDTAERDRLKADRAGTQNWRKWGPYVADRQWGTVREDYSANGDAWRAFPFHHAHARAYRWGEDAIAGVCDSNQRFCLGLALWNGRDAILKERYFGVANEEGNHGEDVKEQYYYLDATPTHSYMRMLYKYPQAAYPYANLVEQNRRRDRDSAEYELLDTGIFAENRYFDVFVEYAKAGPDDLLMRITAHNRGPDAAELHVLPHAWFRNTWTWDATKTRPRLTRTGDGVTVPHPKLPPLFLHADAGDWLFCENESNPQVFGQPRGPGFYKDGVNAFVVTGDATAINPAGEGTKAAAYSKHTIPAGGSISVRLRLSAGTDPFADFDAVFAARIREADAFYADKQEDMADPDARLVQRQAFAGMIWSKQFYYYDVPVWLNGDPGQPPPPEARKQGRNRDWPHLNNADVISMPDKWEYPWYAAWDVAFHCVPLAMIDPEFAKQQILLFTREWYMHPNGQLPAYEWNFSDVNPPVHAWAAWRVFQIDRKLRGDRGDRDFLERVFHKLLLNFTWWVNRKDAEGRNVFQGGFLGLDNIGVFDRSAPLPTGGFVNQADGTAWMAMYALNLLRIALELAVGNPVYEDIATKFFEHFLSIAEAMTAIGKTAGTDGVGLWDDEDGFYYDELNLPDGQMVRLKVRSMVGLIPLFAVETLDPELLDRLPDFARRLRWFLKNRPAAAALVSQWDEPGRGERRLLSLVRGHRLKKILRRVLDETEFLSDYGVRSLSKYHAAHPYTLPIDGATHTVAYWPAESRSGMFGGNSNWRGPLWMPVNYLIIESLQKFHHYYGDDFKVECPTGSGVFLTLEQIADELARRLTRLFLRDETGRRPIFGADAKQQHDPHFRDYLLFPEYFHGDTGRGVGALHQTGWTGLVAKLLQPRAREAECPVYLRPGAKK